MAEERRVQPAAAAKHDETFALVPFTQHNYFECMQMSRPILGRAAEAWRVLNATGLRGVQDSTFRSLATETRAKNSSKESLEEVRARIFGNIIGNGVRSGAKLLRKKLVGEKMASYYMDDIAKRDPLMIDTRAEAKKLKLEKLKRRGKGPPPKGQGKRATKGKKK